MIKIDKIYFDNASTTFPKAPDVAETMYQFMTQIGSNINRGCYENAYSTEELVYETRQLLCDLFHGEDCKNVVFTKNVTESINIILKGFLKPGDHIIVSSMEHNAVMRPLVQLTQIGVTFSRIPCDDSGQLQMDEVEHLVKPNTRAVIMTHASNVCGTIMPIQEIGEFCKQNGLYFFVDSAQTAGVYDIDMEKMNIDAVAFTGHKGLLGPQGIGGFIIKKELVSQIEPLLSGGTGSISHTEEIPEFMPDRFEAGTLNLPGIIGLRQGLLWLQQTGIETVRMHESMLTEYFLEKIKHLEEEKLIKIIGKKDVFGRTGVVSLQTLKRELSESAFLLDDSYHIMTRVGLHCAPSAHKSLGTYPTGTIRFSFGYWNTKEEIDFAIKALEDICNGL